MTAIIALHAIESQRIVVWYLESVKATVTKTKNDE